MVEIMRMMFLVAFLLFHAESVEGFEFRLWPTNLQDTEGFVEIFYNGSWGLIGDPDFQFSDATASLLCKKFNLSLFGYGARNIYQETNTFSHFWLQNLECHGNKQSIDECVKTDEFNRTQYNQYITDTHVSLFNYGSKLYCVDYRLMGGLSQNTGMLLAAFSGTEHSMCYQGFDNSAGNVVCKHLRYNGLVGFTEGDPGSIPLFRNKLTCTGNESSLNECTMSNAVIENCTRAVYITCKAVRLTTWNEYNDEGTVEIFYNGSWGLFDSAYGFDDVTAKFLCETFGFRNVGFSPGIHLLGEAYIHKNAWSGYLSCNGMEADIMQCGNPSSFSFVPYIRSYTNIGAWLYCFDFNITSMRLVNGLNSNEGVVELQIGGRWGSIFMPFEIDTSDLKTGVCQYLGYGGDSKTLSSSVTDYFKYTWMRNFFCDMDMKDFMECYYRIVEFKYSYLTIKCEDTNQCQSNPCLNNGTCVDGDRSYTCTCTERWSGINCEIETNQCQSNPCLNNGTCVDGDRSYTCTCTERWSGINCEIDKDACLSQPCENNGVCVNAINGFVCNCDQGYEGYRCQNEIGDQTTLIVVLISSICVLSIVLATLCCCLRYRREHKKTKTDASNVLGKEGLQNSKEVEAVQTEMEEGHYNEDVYDEIKENNVADHADYIHPVNDVELPIDADGYVKFADNDESVGYYKLKHTKTEDYFKLSGYKF